MHSPVLITPPGEAPVSLDEAKAHLRVDGNDESSAIENLIGAAVSYLDGYTGILGRALVTQTWRQPFDGFARCLRLPLQASAISSITVRARDGTISTIASSNYTLQEDALGSFVRFKDSYSFPGDLYETKAILVDFIAGYGAAEDVPLAIRHAVLLLVGHWFANREAVNVGNITTTLPFAVDALLAPFRRVGL